MSNGTTIGMIIMLGAIIWCLACLARVVVGPNRKTALTRSFKAGLVFFVGVIVLGISGGQQQGSTATPTNYTANTEIEASTPTVPEPNPARPASELLLAASIEPPTTAPVVSARYQTSPTLISLVIANFRPDMAESLREIATQECAGSDFCSIGFWTEDSIAPRTLRMSDEAVKGRLAHYAHNRATGLDTFKWNCEASPFADNCL